MYIGRELLRCCSYSVKQSIMASTTGCAWLGGIGLFIQPAYWANEIFMPVTEVLAWR